MNYIYTLHCSSTDERAWFENGRDEIQISNLRTEKKKKRQVGIDFGGRGE